MPSVLPYLTLLYPTLENLGLRPRFSLFFTTPHPQEVLKTSGYALGFTVPYSTLPNPTLPLRTSSYARGFTLLYHTTPTRSVKNLGLRPRFYPTLPYPFVCDGSLNTLPNFVYIYFCLHFPSHRRENYTSTLQVF